MKKYDKQEMAKIIEIAEFENRHREFKPPFNWKDQKSNWIKETVIRTILGFSNTPQGGLLIIGVSEDSQKRPVVKGLTPDELLSFDQYDTIKGVVESFSSTSINFEIGWGEYSSSKSKVNLILISVSEFQELPTICKRGGQTEKLRRGVVYARQKIGTAGTIAATEVEMGEIIKMAADKNLSELEARGLISLNKKPQPLKESDREKFIQQNLDLEI